MEIDHFVFVVNLRRVLAGLTEDLLSVCGISLITNCCDDPFAFAVLPPPASWSGFALGPGTAFSGVPPEDPFGFAGVGTPSASLDGVASMTDASEERISVTWP